MWPWSWRWQGLPHHITYYINYITLLHYISLHIHNYDSYVYDIMMICKITLVFPPKEYRESGGISPGHWLTDGQ